MGHGGWFSEDRVCSSDRERILGAAFGSPQSSLILPLLEVSVSLTLPLVKLYLWEPAQ